MAVYLKLFVDARERYQKLSDAEFGRLIRAALTYKADGVEVKLDGREELMWAGIKLDIDRDNERQNTVNEARSEAGKKGASSRWQSKSDLPYSKNGNCHLPYSKNGYDKEEDKDKDKEEDKDKDKEQGQQNITPMYDPAVAAVVSDYLDRINPSASHTCLQMLASYAKELGITVCKRAFDIALDNHVTNWNYIKAILQNWASMGVKCLADIDRLDKKRGGKASGGAVGSTERNGENAEKFDPAANERHGYKTANLD